MPSVAVVTKSFQHWQTFTCLTIQVFINSMTQRIFVCVHRVGFTVFLLKTLLSE